MKKTASIILIMAFAFLALYGCEKGNSALTPDPTAEPPKALQDAGTDVATPEQTPPPEPQKPVFTEQFGEFETTDLDGNAYSNSVFADSKLTMVNIWGTFCSPCLMEMPDLGKLSTEYADQGLQIIGIVTDVSDQKGEISQSQVDLAKTLVEQTGANYLHLVPSVSLIDIKLNAVYAIPETVFVNAEGYLVGGPVIGSNTKEGWQEIIDERLALVG